MKGVRFGNLHSYYEWGLILGSKEIQSPEPKINQIEIEGGDGVLDLTDFFGDTKYKNRSLSFQFTKPNIVPDGFLALYSAVQNAIHGKVMDIILDDDPANYYRGRVTINEWKSDKNIGSIVIEVDAEPYKYKLKVTISAAGSYSSTIKSYKTTVAGKSYTASSFTSGVLTSTGTVTISTTVTDSRGRTATKETTVTVVAYTAPKITKFSAVRTNSGVQVAMNFSIASVGEKNTKQYVLSYKPKTGDSWEQLASGSVYSYNSTQTFTQGFSTESSYDLQLVVKDYFGDSAAAIAYAEIPTAFTLLDFNASGKGMAFGKVSEIENQMEVDMDMNIYRTIFMGGNKRANDEKNMYFQTTEDAENVHNCKLYGGNGASVTSIGCWDSARNHGIWRYLSSTQNLVFDANVKVTRANGGDEFVTSDPVVHENRSGRVHFSNGLLIQWGNVTIMPVANTPTAQAVTFGASYTDAPCVFVTAYSTVPGTSVSGVASANITTTGFNAYVTRNGATNTGVMWVAIGYKA